MMTLAVPASPCMICLARGARDEIRMMGYMAKTPATMPTRLPRAKRQEIPCDGS